MSITGPNWGHEVDHTVHAGTRSQNRPKPTFGPSAESFFRIADRWGPNTEEQMTLIGITARSTFFSWKKDSQAVLSQDTLERISHILGIYKTLHILLPDESSADAWIKQANKDPPFGGRSALQHMLSGQVADLFVVRQYLDSQLGALA
jgi:hypothetical protein